MFVSDESALLALRVENAHAATFRHASLNNRIARIIIVKGLWPFAGQRARE